MRSTSAFVHLFVVSGLLLLSVVLRKRYHILQQNIRISRIEKILICYHANEIIAIAKTQCNAPYENQASLEEVNCGNIVINFEQIQNRRHGRRHAYQGFTAPNLRRSLRHAPEQSRQRRQHNLMRIVYGECRK